MRAYLSSYKIGNHPERLVELVGSNKRVAVICNAGDYHSEAENDERARATINEFTKLGFDAERLDLRTYFETNIIMDDLRPYGLVWLCGGNSFILMRAIAQSGFAGALFPLLGDDKIMYGGFSAGACVATETLEGIDLCDDPNVVPKGYGRMVAWEGLGMVPFSIAPHFESDHPESEIINDVVAYFQEHNMAYQTLRDGEAIIVDGEKMEKIA